MENVSLLLFYFMYQRMRCSIRRRAINRRKRRMFLILHRIKQNLLFLQSIQTATLTLLVAAARVVHPRLEREYWALPRPRLGWFELILQDDRQSRYWNNRNHTVGRLRSSNWIVEGYHQYRHDMEMQVDFRYSMLNSVF